MPCNSLEEAKKHRLYLRSVDTEVNAYIGMTILKIQEHGQEGEHDERLQK